MENISNSRRNCYRVVRTDLRYSADKITILYRDLQFVWIITAGADKRTEVRWNFPNYLSNY